MYGSLPVTLPFLSTLCTCWLLPRCFRSGEAIISQFGEDALTPGSGGRLSVLNEPI